MEALDTSRFVPKNFPEVEALRAQGCIPPRRERINISRGFFCSKWGDSFKCICPPNLQVQGQVCWETKRADPLRGVGREMQSLNHFSALPIRPEGRYPGVQEMPTMSEKMGLVVKNQCPKRELGYSMTCPPGYGIQPSFMMSETVCGACAPLESRPPAQPYDCGDTFPGFDISTKNMPFRVCFTKENEPEKVKVRTGVSACLQPSHFRDMTTCYREGYKDFMKSKTPQQLSLYRSPLVIDHRRARPQIPVDQNPGILVGVNSGPLSINARPVHMQLCEKKGPRCLPEKPEFQVFVPKPIVIPVDNLPECEIALV